MSRRFLPQLTLGLLVVSAWCVCTSGAQQPNSAPEKKPKKVWTNDNLGELRDNAAVSVVGPAAPTKAAPAKAAAKTDTEKAQAKPQPLPPAKDPSWYRSRLAPLRAELERANAEIRQMQEFLAGGRTGQGGIPAGQFTAPLNPTDRIAQIEKHKREVQDKINEIEEVARRNGLAPGEIR